MTSVLLIDSVQTRIRGTEDEVFMTLVAEIHTESFEPSLHHPFPAADRVLVAISKGEMAATVFVEKRVVEQVVVAGDDDITGNDRDFAYPFESRVAANEGGECLTAALCVMLYNVAVDEFEAGTTDDCAIENDTGR